MMSQNLCQCHCGTRIDLDQQLLQQRELWKQKYHCLQRQVSTDVQTLKETIYAQCANLMQQQFTQKETEHINIINSKNQQIKDLIARVITMESQVKVLTKEKELLEATLKDIEGLKEEKVRELQTIRAKSVKEVRAAQESMEQQITRIKKRMEQGFAQERTTLEKENQHLKHKVKEFQKKYQTILPEVEKIKNALSNKTAQYQQLQSKYQKHSKDSQRRVDNLVEENESLSKKNKNVQSQLRRLADQIQDQTVELQNLKRQKPSVKVQPVYIDRPIEVPKIIQRIIEVQKVIRQYVEPSNSGQLLQLQTQNAKLHEQLSKVLKELHIIEGGFERSSEEYEECIKAHRQNVQKYKHQRENLVKRIEQQNRELEMLQGVLNKRKVMETSTGNVCHDSEKIVVHVKSDGSYTKTTEKIPNERVNVEKGQKQGSAQGNANGKPNLARKK